MQLTKRMKTIADMVTKGNIVADIGTDHAYIPIYLINNKLIPGAVAMDINRGPLERAYTHIHEYGLDSYIKIRLSYGMEKLNKNEADSIIIAGMGGLLIRDILSEGLTKLKSVKEIIVQPQSEQYSVRKFIAKNGFAIIDEEVLEEDGKYYFVIKAVHGNNTYETEIDFKYGKILLERKNNVLKEFLLKEKKKYESIKNTLEKNGNENSCKRLLEIEAMLADNQECMHYWG